MELTQHSEWDEPTQAPLSVVVYKPTNTLNALSLSRAHDQSREGERSSQHTQTGVDTNINLDLYRKAERETRAQSRQSNPTITFV